MSDLIMRAEQGILGALLAGQRDRFITEHLAIDDFGHPTHQAIYRALRHLEETHHEPEPLASAVADIVDQPGIDPGWLRELADNAPDIDRVRAYTQIVMQAAFDRDITDFGGHYHAAAQRATEPATAARLSRLGDTLDTRAATFTTTSSIDPERSVHSPGPPTPGPAKTDLHREDLIIADLLHHPDQARAVAPWLDPAIFTTAQRRLTFEIAVSLAYDHDALDPVILAWHVQQARDLDRLHHHQPDPPDAPAESDYAYLTRLEATTVAAGTAIAVGRELLTEYVRAALPPATTDRTIQTPLRQPGPRIRPISPEPPATPTPHAGIRPIEP